RIELSDGFVEARERKRLQTLGATVGLGIGLLLGLMFVISLAGPIDPASLVAAGILTLIPIVLTVAMYRPPRALRLYPAERLARRYRKVLFWPVASKWIDLSAGGVSTRRETVVSKESTDREGGAVALLGCLFALLGPLGLLLSLGMLREKREVRLPVFAIASEGARVPLAVFDRRAEADRVVSLYEALFEDASDGDIAS
ncbi:MAG: hypothetical protein ACPGYV_13700, partial [Phycisphaeraceae bacterium]